MVIKSFPIIISIGQNLILPMRAGGEISKKFSTGVINFMIHRVNLITSIKINSMLNFKFLLNGIHILQSPQLL